MRRHLLPCTVAVVLLVCLTLATSAQPLSPTPAYKYCPESTQRLYTIVPRANGSALNDAMIVKVAEEWAVDRGLRPWSQHACHDE